jgi:hypothetical protein
VHDRDQGAAERGGREERVGAEDVDEEEPGKLTDLLFCRPLRNVDPFISLAGICSSP